MATDRTLSRVDVSLDHRHGLLESATVDTLARQNKHLLMFLASWRREQTSFFRTWTQELRETRLQIESWTSAQTTDGRLPTSSPDSSLHTDNLSIASHFIKARLCSSFSPTDESVEIFEQIMDPNAQLMKTAVSIALRSEDDDQIIQFLNRTYTISNTQRRKSKVRRVSRTTSFTTNHDALQDVHRTIHSKLQTVIRTAFQRYCTQISLRSSDRTVTMQTFPVITSAASRMRNSGSYLQSSEDDDMWYEITREAMNAAYNMCVESVRSL